LRTPFDVFISTFHTNWKAHKEDGKDYSFEVFCELLITDQHRLLEEGNLGGKHQAHLLKGKGKMDSRNRVQTDASAHKTCIYMIRDPRDNHNEKSKEEDMSVLWKDWTCGESKCFKKRDDLEEKVKDLKETCVDCSSTH
jgi:hypothetical protein